jgi:hypothetical protein
MDAALRLAKWYGITLAVAAALIMFPPTGVFLTILTQGRLPSLILVLFTLHIGCLACAKKISLGWLVLPIGFCAVWLGWVNSKREAVYLEKSKLESQNQITASFEKSHTLVFPDEDGLVIRARRYFAAPMRVYMGKVEFSAATRLTCSESYCGKEPLSPPPSDALVFHELGHPDRSRPIYRHSYEITQSSPTAGKRVIGHFNYGELFLPTWSPLFFAGCYLIGGPSPGWDCTVTPETRRISYGETGSRPENSDPLIASLANMLGF